MNSAKTVNDMDKAEFIVTKHYCHVKCEPQEEKCKDCELLKIYREIYDTGRKTDIAQRPLLKVAI